MHSVTHALPCQFQQLPVSAHVDRPVKEVPLENNIHLFGSCANTLKITHCWVMNEAKIPPIMSGPQHCPVHAEMHTDTDFVLLPHSHHYA